MGRHRNGSVSSNRSAVDANQAANPGNSVPNSAPVQRKKKGGLLSLFCCGVPDDAHPVDEPADAPTHKVEKLPPRPTTASRRAQTPSEHTAASKSQAQEKDVAQTQNPPEPSRAQRISGTTNQDQSTLAEESKQSTLIGAAPTVTVEPPRSQEAEAGASASEGPAAKDGDGDTEMVDAAALEAPEPPQPVDTEDLPPPPAPMPDAPTAPQNEGGLVAASEQPPQDALLPPIQPHFKGRKCLVLDLDETLVHSSFKVIQLSVDVPLFKR